MSTEKTLLVTESKSSLIVQTKLITTTSTNYNGTTTLKRTCESLEDEADEEDDKPSASKVAKREACYASYRKQVQIQHTSTSKATAERGQIQDFKHDLHYVLTTLFDTNATANLKSLSLTQLLKKSVAPEFRDFIRTQNVHMNKLFNVITELSTSPVISMSAACLLYFMARDRKGVPISEQCIHLMASLLKQEQPPKSDEEYGKHMNLVWSIMQDWLRYWLNKSSKTVKFDVTRENLSTPYLILETLAYISIKEQSDVFKNELLNTGCLTTIVAKLDKVVVELVNSVGAPKETSGRLKIVERCYRILENAAAFNPKNQTFLVQHRNSLLIFSSAKFLNFSLKFVDEVNKSKKKDSQQQNDCSKIFDNICLLCRVLMNISHENENAALKIGQIAGFLGNCLHLLARHSIFAPKEKFFDLSVMMYGLLVNLLERCAANRRKFIHLTSDFLDENEGIVRDLPSLNILTKLFIRHDSAAKTVDEEFDNDLIADEHEEEAENGKSGEKAANMSQDEVLAAIQSMMSKASTHMEDSMIASYCSLAVAILVGTDQKLADQVRQLLPDKEFTPMMEQLERFLDFMRITKLKENTVNNIEQVLNSFQIAASNSTAAAD